MSVLLSSCWSGAGAGVIVFGPAQSLDPYFAAVVAPNVTIHFLSTLPVTISSPPDLYLPPDLSHALLPSSIVECFGGNGAVTLQAHSNDVIALPNSVLVVDGCAPLFSFALQLPITFTPFHA